MSQDASDVYHSNGLKLPTQMVLEVDASEQILKI